jgi:hypothetical protein
MTATLAQLSWTVAPRGMLLDAEQAFELITRPGVDGSAILWDAVRAAPQTLELHAVVPDASTAEQYRRTVRASMQTSTPYIDPLGRTWTVQILSAQCWYMQRVDAQFLVIAVFVVLPETRSIADAVVL